MSTGGPPDCATQTPGPAMHSCRCLPRQRQWTGRLAALSRQSRRGPGAPHAYDQRLGGVGYVTQKQAEIMEQQRKEEQKKINPQELSTRAGRETMTVNEEDPARYPYHQQLFAAAKSGACEQAERVVAAMIAAGLMPGPRAWHSVIFAYVKAKDAYGALDATRRAYHSGIQPLGESYTALIHAFMEAGDTEKAIDVLESMYNSGIDARPGWLMLTTSLFRMGYEDLGMTYVKFGEEEQWQPNSQLMEYVVAAHVRMDGHMKGQDVIRDMIQKGMRVTPQHWYPVISGASTPQEAAIVCEKIPSDQLDTECFNRALEKFKGNENSGAESQALCGHMDRMGVRKNQRTHVILLEIMAEETQASSMTLLDEFDRLRRLGPGGTKLLSDRAVSQLLDLFSTRWKEGNSVRQLVAALREDGRRITDLVPVAQKVDADENAPSFATSWLAGRLSDFKTVAERDEQADRVRSVVAEDPQGDEREFEVREDLCLLEERVDKKGIAVMKPIPVSRMSLDMCKKELQIRGLSMDGNLSALRKRIQVARKAVRAPLAQEQREKEERKRLGELRKRIKAQEEAQKAAEEGGADGAQAQAAGAAAGQDGRKGAKKGETPQIFRVIAMGATVQVNEEMEETKVPAADLVTLTTSTEASTSGRTGMGMGDMDGVMEEEQEEDDDQGADLLRQGRLELSQAGPGPADRAKGTAAHREAMMEGTSAGARVALRIIEDLQYMDYHPPLGDFRTVLVAIDDEQLPAVLAPFIRALLTSSGMLEARGQAQGVQALLERAVQLALQWGELAADAVSAGMDAYDTLGVVAPPQLVAESRELLATAALTGPRGWPGKDGDEELDDDAMQMGLGGEGDEDVDDAEGGDDVERALGEGEDLEEDGDLVEGDGEGAEEETAARGARRGRPMAAGKGRAALGEFADAGFDLEAEDDLDGFLDDEDDSAL